MAELFSGDYVDEAADGPVHLRHSIDGWPLCWPMDAVASFVGTFQVQAATCPECLCEDEPG